MTEFFRQIKTEHFHLIIEPLSKYNNGMLSKREIEIFALKSILNILNPKLKVEYNLYGAPFLNTNNAISISHSKKYIAIIFSQKQTSIDIELISQKALKVSPKFLNKKELAKVNDKETATLYWSAKECLYKIFQKGKLNFSSDLIVTNVKEKHLECLMFDKKYILQYEKFDSHYLVYYFD